MFPLLEQGCTGAVTVLLSTFNKACKWLVAVRTRPGFSHARVYALPRAMLLGAICNASELLAALRAGAGFSLAALRFS